MIMKYYLHLHLLALLLCCCVANAQTSNECLNLREVKENELAFQEGERLTIVANYKWGIINTDVGEAVISISKERFRDTSYFYARAYAKTYKFYDRFFMVRDVYEGRFLQHNLRPLYFHRDINEGGYQMQNTYSFNQNDNSIKGSIRKKGNEPKHFVLQGEACTFDFISLFYNSRNIDFANIKEGHIIPISFAVDDEMYNIHYRYIGKEVIKVSGLGKFSCYKIAAKPVAGEVFDGKNEIMIWITDDKNHIPVYIETPITVGRISARLSKFENLKWPLTSKQ